MYNLIEYSDNYSNASGSLWQYYRNKTSLTAASAIKDLLVLINNSKSFKYKQKITSNRQQWHKK